MYGGNLGSVARVMRNFGLRDLVLVDPAPGILDDPLLEPMARTGIDIIRRARVSTSVEAAVAEAEIALAFTTRVGRRRRDVNELRGALEWISAEAPQARVAAVFGREDSGLTTSELDHCHWAVRIPTHPDLPSLNLAQAVGLFAYEIAEARRRASPTPDRLRKPATAAQLEGLYAHFEKVLAQIGFIEEASPARMMNEIRRIFSRRLPDPRDVRILRGVLSKVELALVRASKGLDRDPAGGDLASPPEPRE
jgi:TrmH family RNA methyltransferase